MTINNQRFNRRNPASSEHTARQVHPAPNADNMSQHRRYPAPPNVVIHNGSDHHECITGILRRREEHERTRTFRQFEALDLQLQTLRNHHRRDHQEMLRTLRQSNQQNVHREEFDQLKTAMNMMMDSIEKLTNIMVTEHKMTNNCTKIHHLHTKDINGIKVMLRGLAYGANAAELPKEQPEEKMEEQQKEESDEQPEEEPIEQQEEPQDSD